MSTQTVSGSCSCRRVRFEARLPTLFVAHCHCENCRRAHGAAFVTFAGFKAEALQFLAGEEHLVRYVTETDATRSFCSTCGSTLFYEGPGYPGEIHAVVGNIDGELDRMPGGHAFSKEAPTWCPITDDLPQK